MITGKPLNGNDKDSWNRCLAEHARGPDYWDLTPAYSAYRDAISPVLKSHARDRTLDLGAGLLTLERLCKPFVSSYTSLDLSITHPRLSVVGNAAAIPFQDECFDTVILTQVLEHVPHPSRVVAEVARILRQGGKLIVSVPHISYLHGEPHDYFRFTKYGLGRMLKDGGLHPEDYSHDTGIFTFVTNLPFMMLLAKCHRHGFLFKMARGAGQLSYRITSYMDRVLDHQGLFAVNIIMVAEKP